MTLKVSMSKAASCSGATIDNLSQWGSDELAVPAHRLYNIFAVHQAASYVMHKKLDRHTNKTESLNRVSSFILSSFKQSRSPVQIATLA